MERTEYAGYLSVLSKWTTGPRSKWVTLFIWIACTIIASLAWPAANRMDRDSSSYLPHSAPSVQAQRNIEQSFPSATGTPALVVWYNSQGITSKDVKIITSVSQTLLVHPVTSQVAVPPLASMPATALSSLMSKDKTTLVLPVTLKSNATQAQLNRAIAQIKRIVEAQAGPQAITGSLNTHGLHVRITGPAGIAVDAVSLFQHADFTLLMATTLLVLALLIILYRSPILAFVPLVTVGIAYGLISPILGELSAQHLVTFDAQTTSIMTVLLFGASTDYCLLMVARYREQLYRFQSKDSAIREAVGGAAGAIALSGLTVALALVSLLLAQYESYHEFAIPFCLAIVIMALVSVTLLPLCLPSSGASPSFHSYRVQKRVLVRHPRVVAVVAANLAL
ncbi:MMPL family transporter [Alicyclobacillus sacchari]|uniref:MMPL family transporter n=1 Tax=Alicyclobacillus sacchari TaxID=392010 RepID=UPI0024E0458E|nr:MMPL family transporter [Alicyclobacillus sacchari]